MGADPCSSSQFSSLESSCYAAVGRANPNIGQNMAWSLQQTESLTGPIAIFWDFENCPIPSDVRPEDVAGNIRTALQVHPRIKGTVTVFSAYGDFNAFPRRLREGCQRTGVKLIDVPHGRKDAADKAILIDMFLFALDNPPPSSVLLISGDVDFAPALHILGQRGYTVILVTRDRSGISSALNGAGKFVWDWQSVAHGEGFLPLALSSHGSDVSWCRSFRGVDISNPLPEEKIVYQGTGSSESTPWPNGNEGCLRSQNCIGSSSSLPSSATAPSKCFPGSSNGFLKEQDEGQDSSWWVQPGDFRGLKAQFSRLLEISGGCLPLQRISADYHKMFGRPLYVVEYGERKLLDLLKRMTDILTVVRKGNKQFVLLRVPIRMAVKANSFSESKDPKGKRIADPMSCLIECHEACDMDELSDDGRFIWQDEQKMVSIIEPVSELDEQMEIFKLELQELLVSHGCKMLFELFESLYEQRYKKSLDYRRFGRKSLDDLLDMARDVVDLVLDKNSKRILVAKW